VKQHHAPLLNTENNPRNPAARQAAPYFPQFMSKRSNERHSDRPRKLNVLDILAAHFPVLHIETLLPPAHRFPASVGAVEADWQAFPAGARHC